MPALFRYTCHNPRCPSLYRVGKQYTWRGVPPDPQEENQHECPYCGTRKDGYLEVVAERRIQPGEMTKDQPTRGKIYVNTGRTKAA